MYKGRKRAGGLGEGGITRVGVASPDQLGKFKHHLPDPVSAILYMGGEKITYGGLHSADSRGMGSVRMNPKTEGTPVRGFKQNR